MLLFEGNHQTKLSFFPISIRHHHHHNHHHHHHHHQHNHYRHNPCHHHHHHHPKWSATIGVDRGYPALRHLTPHFTGQGGSRGGGAIWWLFRSRKAKQSVNLKIGRSFGSSNHGSQYSEDGVGSVTPKQSSKWTDNAFHPWVALLYAGTAHFWYPLPMFSNLSIFWGGTSQHHPLALLCISILSFIIISWFQI